MGNSAPPRARGTQRRGGTSWNSDFWEEVHCLTGAGIWSRAGPQRSWTYTSGEWTLAGWRSKHWKNSKLNQKLLLEQSDISGEGTTLGWYGQEKRETGRRKSSTPSTPQHLPASHFPSSTTNWQHITGSSRPSRKVVCRVPPQYGDRGVGFKLRDKSLITGSTHVEMTWLFFFEI